MIAAGQQFAAAVRGGVVHLAFWSAAESGWRLACTDEEAQLQGQDPMLSCAICEEVADEEVGGNPVCAQPGEDVSAVLARIPITTGELLRVAARVS